MPKLLANGIRFNYWRVGEGPDLVMLHGLGGNQAIWHLRLVPLLRSEYRITTYDLRGHGRSEMPPNGYTTEELAADLRSVMDALEIERAHLMGHSLGADICLHFALLYPKRAEKLVLVEAGIPALLNERKHGDWEGWAYWAEVIEKFTGSPVPAERRTDVGYLIRRSLDVPILYGLAKGLPRKKEPFLRLLDTTTVVKDYEVVGDLTLENLATIPHPKLLAYDGRSPYLSTFNVLRTLLLNCTPVLLPPSQYRHFSPLEEPDVLLAHLQAFLGWSAIPPLSAQPGRHDR